MDAPLLLNIGPGYILDGRFEILDILGSGGFATVYKARQANIDRMVAIKVLGLAPNRTPDKMEHFRQRFYMEARNASNIDHPDIVNIYDYGVTPEGLPYIVMELLSGHTLTEELDVCGPLKPQRALPLFTRCLDALQAAHDKQIVHKDLKPSNLFMTRPGTMVEALRVLDFGIAALADADDDERLTATDQFVGTAIYCAPEYYESKLVTPALDVYQMGLVLAEALMGRSVVTGSNPMRAIIAHCSGELYLPWKLMQSPLGPILCKATAHDPQRRYTNAGAFRDALQEVDPAQIPILLEEDLFQMVHLGSGEPRSEATGSEDKGSGSSEEFIFGDTSTGDRTLDSSILPRTPVDVEALTLDSVPSAKARAAAPEEAAQEPDPQEAAPEPGQAPEAREPDLAPPVAPRQGKPVALYGLLALLVAAALGVGAWIALAPPEGPAQPDREPPGGEQPGGEAVAAQPEARATAPPQEPEARAEAPAEPSEEEAPPKEPAPPEPTRVWLQVSPQEAEIQAPQGLLQEQGQGEALWQFGPEAPPWRVELSAKNHKTLYLELAPDPDRPQALVLRRGEEPEQLSQAPMEVLGANKEGRYRAVLALERKARGGQKPKRTPKNQLID